jgi:hypothetical protein
VRPGYRWFPEVAFDGTNYLVVWEDIVDNNRPSGAQVTRRERSSIERDPDLHGPGSGGGCRLDGANYLVVWKDVRVGNSRVTARVSRACARPERIRDLDESVPQHEPAVAFGGPSISSWDGCASARDVWRVCCRAARFSTERDPDLDGRNGQQMPSVAYDGVNFLVTWDDARAVPSAPTSSRARITASGTVLDPGGIPMPRERDRAGRRLRSGELPRRVARRLRPTYDVFATRVTPGGGILDPPASRSHSSSTCRAPRRRLRRCRLSLAWETAAEGRYDIQGRG